MKILPIRKGGSVPFEFDRDGLTIEGWVCTIKVKQYADDTAIISRVITPTNGVWQGLLTSAETDTLTAGTTYRLFAIMTNSTTLEEEQVEARFSLTADWAA